MATNNKRVKLEIQDEETLGRKHTPYEKHILRMREYRQNNKNKISKYRTEYYKNNRENIREYSRVYMKEKLDSSPEKRKKHNELTTAYRHQKKAEITQEQYEQNELLKQQKKQLRMLTREQSYNEKVIQDSIDLTEKIKETQELIKSMRGLSSPQTPIHTK